MTPRRLLWGLIAVSTLLRLAWAASLGPGNDEAYHYLYAVHPDWSYFDHPPMLAVVEAVGMTLTGGSSVFGLRLGFIGLFAGSTYLMWRLGSRLYGERAGLLAAFVLNVTAYYGIAAASFALPDGPMLFFWLLTLNALTRAVDEPERLRLWIGVGLAWGGAMLSKYIAVLLPAGAVLYFVLERSARPCLRRPGPHLALLVGLVVFSPVVVWNAQHGWASFAFQGGRAAGPPRLRLELLARAVGEQALYLFPWVWFSLIAVLIGRGRRFFTDSDRVDRFLICQSIPPLLVFSAVACLRPVLPHWSLAAFLPLMTMLGRDWSERWSGRPVAMRRRLIALAAVPIVLAGLSVGLIRSGWLQRGEGGTLGVVKASSDPTLDLYGWDQVGRELERRGLLDSPDTFLFTSKWFQSGQVAFAIKNKVPVLCYNPNGARGFAHWSRPGQWVGRDGVLIVIDESDFEPQAYRDWFERIDPIGEFPVARSGMVVRRVRLFLCRRQTRPFPFDGRVPDSTAGSVAASRSPDQARR